MKFQPQFTCLFTICPKLKISDLLTVLVGGTLLIILLRVAGLSLINDSKLGATKENVPYSTSWKIQVLKAF